MTSPQTLRALQRLKTTHPAPHQKLSNDDTEPDPVTKQRGQKPNVSGGSKKSAKAVAVPERELEELEEPEFTCTGDFDDSCDVPLEIMIEYVVAEGKEVLDGLAVNEQGGLERTGDAENSDITVGEDGLADVPEAGSSAQAEELGRGKRIRSRPAWQNKDWVFTRDTDVKKDGGRNARKKH